jgi:cyclic pyranopterin phosphate synthase
MKSTSAFAGKTDRDGKGMDRKEKVFTHLNEDGSVRMIDVGGKSVTRRIARAVCRIRMRPSTLKRISGGTIQKGDVLTTAKIAGILAAKRVHELIPLCHPIPIDGVDVSFAPGAQEGILDIRAEVATDAKTGAEMEALQAAVQAALTVYDMCKSVDREMTIEELALVEKRGGKSGTWKRK